jgi:NADH-quinone oxidoreductase subunit L
MLDLIFLIPLLPFAGFVTLVLCGCRISASGVAMVGVGSVAVTCVIAALVATAFLVNPPENHYCTQLLWHWIRVDGLSVGFSFRLDALSLVMVLVVTFVSLLIHVYSVEFMRGEAGYSRFFAFMNLFVGSMLILVLADNFVLLYLGWEGVGLCSYLLIGFWYHDSANVRAARKAFIVTRVGDAAFAVGLFLLFNELGTLQIQKVLERAQQQWPASSTLAITASALLLAGAVGKSAQLPLQTWLPDAMAGPTPVSALIHAATMVTAGVYLIARTNILFTLAPPVQIAVGCIGAVTLLLAACSALTQHDIKRVLAYSTMSQIGYMFLGLGAGAGDASIYHLLTHAFFKALLFLAAGVVILALDHEHDLFKMGGLRKALPLTFWVFLAGAWTLAGLPPMGGFSSKSLILATGWEHPILWAAGVTGIFLTSIYSFRLMFLIFYGPQQQTVIRSPGKMMTVPLAILAMLTLGTSALNWPTGWGGATFLSDFLAPILPPSVEESATVEHGTWREILYVLLGLAGIPIAWAMTIGARSPFMHFVNFAPITLLRQLWFRGWGFDWLYHWLFVKPFVLMARPNDFIDLVYRSLAGLTELSSRALKTSQSGYLRWYALGIVLGAILILALVLFL